MFRTCFRDSFQGELAAQYAKDEGYTKVGIVYCSADTYSAGLRDAFTAACGSKGLEIVAEESVASMAEVDYTNQFNKMVSAGAELVFTPFYYDVMGPYLVPQARSVGFNGVLLGADGVDNTETTIPDGADLSVYNNVYFVNHYYTELASSGISADFVASYEAEYGETPNNFDALAYDAVYVYKAIGVEGQLYIGAYATALIAGGYYGMDKIPPALQIPVALLGGALAGMLYALIPAILKAYINIDVVVTTIMFNYIAIALTRFMCKAFHQGSETYDSTEAIMETAVIPKIMTRYRCTYAIFIALAIVVIVTFIIYKTRLGYEISAIGRQFEFSEAVGMRAKKKIMIVFAISGIIAGLAGATEVMGVNKNFMPNFSQNPGLGWEGYFVAVLSDNHPIAVLIVAIIFGGFRYGSISAQSKVGMPLDLLNILKSTLILFYAIRYISANNIKFKKKGTNWMKEKSNA